MNLFPINPECDGMVSLASLVGGLSRALEIYYDSAKLSLSYVTHENHLGLIPFADWIKYPFAHEMERSGLAHADVDPRDGEGVYIVGARPRFSVVRSEVAHV